MRSVQWIEKGGKSFYIHCKPFSAKNETAIMRNTEQEEVLKALGSDLSENEVIAVEKKWQGRTFIGITDHFQQKGRSKLCKYGAKK